MRRSVAFVFSKNPAARAARSFAKSNLKVPGIHCPPAGWLRDSPPSTARRTDPPVVDLGEEASRPEEMGQCLEGHHPLPSGCLLSQSGPAPTFSFRFLRPSVSLPSIAPRCSVPQPAMQAVKMVPLREPTQPASPFKGTRLSLSEDWLGGVGSLCEAEEKRHRCLSPLRLSAGEFRCRPRRAAKTSRRRDTEAKGQGVPPNGFRCKRYF
jgi:hypothetical protein